MSYNEFVSAIEKLGLEKYRADQVLDWVYKKHIFVFEKNDKSFHRASTNSR